MWQAVLDDSGIVVAVNDWDAGVGVPCDPNTPVGQRWNGVEFVETVESIAKRYDKALLAHFDSVAQSRRYDNRLTCALRAGYAGPFQQEGIAFGTWMDNCNESAYQLMADVLSGTKPLPTIEEFISGMPTINWG